MQQIENVIERLLTDAGASEFFVPSLRLFVLLVALGILAAVSFWVTRTVIVNALYGFFKRTPIAWDDQLADFRVFDSLAHFVPALLVRVFAPVLFKDFDAFLPWVIRLTDVYLIFISMRIVIALSRVIEFSMARSSVLTTKP